jgi:Peptidase family M1 domain
VLATELGYAGIGFRVQPALAKQYYSLNLDIDYEGARIKGRELVRFSNSTHQDLETVTFHLYPNVGLTEEEEPWIVVTRVLSGGRDLRVMSKSRGAVLKVWLPAKLAPRHSLELTLEFVGRVPIVQREETSLLAHFLQEVSDAMSTERQTRDARDIYFSGEQAMLLGYAYPMLAADQSPLSDQSLAAGAGSIVFTEVADYDVTVACPEGLEVIASGVESGRRIVSGTGQASKKRREFTFKGERMRGFAVIIAERLKMAEKRTGEVRVVSWFREGDERLGSEVLEIASRVVQINANKFGDYPFQSLNVVELPLPAGYSGIEFPGLIALAQAYYIDFEAPEAAHLPAIVKEQADLIKAAREFTIAHETAHQWWGVAVGSDPQRFPYLDEALANYCAAYYYEAAYGADAGANAIEQQLRANYLAYRMLNGPDLEIDRAAKDFRNALQYSAIVQAKGAMLIVALRKELGDKAFFGALKSYYENYRFQIVTPVELRRAMLLAAKDPASARDLFQRWLREKHADEDIGVADVELFTPSSSRIRSFGKIFGWIGRTAARPF